MLVTGTETLFCLLGHFCAKTEKGKSLRFTQSMQKSYFSDVQTEKFDLSRSVPFMGIELSFSALYSLKKKTILNSKDYIFALKVGIIKMPII